MKNINFNYASILNICQPAQQVMVYGWQHCLYADLISDLRKGNSPIQKVFDHSIGEERTVPNLLTTLEGNKIKQINYNAARISKHGRDISGRNTARICKAGLTNIVLENYRRKNTGQPIIPVIFCFDIENNSYQTNASSINSREESIDGLITHSELRRIYKLCIELKANEAEIANVAQETFKFVKLTQDQKNNEYVLELMKPFWEDNDWEKKWEARKASKKTSDPFKTYRWREQVSQFKLKEKSKIMALAKSDYNELVRVYADLLFSMKDEVKAPIAPDLSDFRNWLREKNMINEEVEEEMNDIGFPQMYRYIQAIVQ